MLSVLRPCDRHSIGRLVAGLGWQAPPHGMVEDPLEDALADPFGSAPCEYALGLVGLPGAPAILASGPSPTTVSALGWACGPCAGPMAAEVWGPDCPPQLVASVGLLSGPGFPYRELAANQTPPPGEPLLAVLQSPDRGRRTSIASAVVNGQLIAERWLCEALAGDDRHSVAWRLADRCYDPRTYTDPDRTWTPQPWQPGQEPPTSLSQGGRSVCIGALAELRPLDWDVLLVLRDDLAFVPDTWPHNVGPAGFALARVGLPALQVLRYVHGDTPEFRRGKLEVVGLMLGRFAAEPFKKIKERGYDAWPGIDDDIAYLEREYAGAKGIYEYIPDEPPRAE